jgi:hypothetical protein
MRVSSVAGILLVGENKNMLGNFTHDGRDVCERL